MKPRWIFTLPFALCLAALPLAAPDPPSIKVTGVAEERVPADEIRFRCEIRSTGENLAEVAQENRTQAAAVTAMLRNLGLDEGGLRTSAASFGEDVEFHDRKRVKLGYVATTTLVIRSDNLELYDTLWIELAKVPGVAVESAEFALRDVAEARARARKKALEAARAKATEMAAALEARIGAPLRITEAPAFGGWRPNNPRNSIDAVLSEGGRSAALEPGLIEVVEQVEVEFELIE